MGGSVWVNPKPSVPPQRGVLCPPGFSSYITHCAVSPRLTQVIPPPRKIGKVLLLSALTAGPHMKQSFIRTGDRLPGERLRKNRIPPHSPLWRDNKPPMMKPLRKTCPPFRRTGSRRKKGRSQNPAARPFRTCGGPIASQPPGRARRPHDVPYDA
jgi:hypothetical protein